jgi:hypothetical protein
MARANPRRDSERGRRKQPTRPLCAPEGSLVRPSRTVDIVSGWNDMEGRRFLCAPPSNALAQSSDATFSVSAPINGAPGPFPLHRPEDGAPTQDADNDATVDRPTLSKQLRAPAEDDDDDEAILLLGLGTARPGPAGISGSVGALARELSGSPEV